MKNIQSTIFKALFLAGALSASLAFAQSTSPSTAATVAVATTVASTPACTLIDPQVFTQSAVDQVLAILAKDQNEITNNFPAVQQDIQAVLSQIIDINVMSQFVVVPPTIWSNASAADQAAFNAAFLKFIINLYTTPLKHFDNQLIRVYKSRVNWNTQSRVQINSVIQNPGAGSSAGDIPVSFILQQNGCSWLFIDFVVDGISALANIQSQIASIVQGMTNPSLSDLTLVLVKHNTATV